MGPATSRISHSFLKMKIQGYRYFLFISSPLWLIEGYTFGLTIQGSIFGYKKKNLIKLMFFSFTACLSLFFLELHASYTMDIIDDSWVPWKNNNDKDTDNPFDGFYVELMVNLM